MYSNTVPIRHTHTPGTAAYDTQNTDSVYTVIQYQCKWDIHTPGAAVYEVRLTLSLFAQLAHYSST